MKRSLLFIGVLLCGGFLANPLASAADEENLYRTIYAELQEKPQEMALERVSRQLRISESDGAALLRSPTATLLQKLPFCSGQRIPPEELLQCFETFQEIFSAEQKLAAYEAFLSAEILAGDRWANGTLADGSFDIIVDLNVIDVILFGPKAQIPEARVAGKIASGRTRSFSDLIAPLRKESPQTPSGNSTPPGTGRGDTLPPGGTNPFVPPPSPPGRENPPPPALMCTDPEALFLEFSPSEGDSGAKDDGTSGQEGGNAGGGQNVSDPETELPALSGKDSDFAREEYPDIREVEESEVCEGDRVPVFNRMFCVPRFCQDLICIFIETKPGKAFALASRETPTCVECVVQKGVEVLATLEQTVEPAQNACNKRYCVRKFLSLFGLDKIDFIAIPKPLPFLVYPDEENAPDDQTQKTNRNSAETQKPQSDLEKRNEESAHHVTQSATRTKTKNEALADLLSAADCLEVLSRFPEGSVTLSQEIYDLCAAITKAQQKNSIDRVSDTASGEASKEEQERLLEQRRQFVTEIDQFLRVFQDDLGQLEKNLSWLTPQEIQQVQQCIPPT